MNRPWRVMVTGLALVGAAACGGSGEPRGDVDPTGGHKPGDGGGMPDDAGDQVRTPDAGSGRPDAGERPEIPASIAVVVENAPLTLTDGVTGELSFDVPEGAISVSVTVQGDRRGTYVLGGWVDAAGNELVAPGWSERGQLGPALCDSCDNRVAASEATFAAIAPNNQDAVLEAGRHTISVLGYRVTGFQTRPMDGDVQVTVHAKLRGALPEAGVLDLNLHFTGAGEWSAETAGSSEEFQGMLAEVAAIYGQVGLKLGSIRYFDVDRRFRAIESTMGDTSDMMDLLSEGDEPRPNAVNVFFVDNIMIGGPFGGFGVVLGIAGGIPGPPLKQRDPRGGVVIAVEAHKDERVGGKLSTTVAHEVGHFLGLFHTSEQAFFGPQLHDPLDDTPTNDASYLMFNTGEGDKLSPWQGRVMLSNPWVRHEEVIQ